MQGVDQGQGALRLAEVAREGGCVLKVIIETALLTDAEKRRACELSKRARANFVKTSTGFSKGGATTQDVALMARAVDYVNAGTVEFILSPNNEFSPHSSDVALRSFALSYDTFLCQNCSPDE